MDLVDVSSWGVKGGRYSSDEVYRWSFTRRWGSGPFVCWVGLNPGKGDTDRKPRPTLRKMVWWSQRWGYGGIIIVNLFAYRTTQPPELYSARRAGIDIVGERNDSVIARATRRAALTVAAWGVHGRLYGRGEKVTSMLIDPVCLGVTSRGEPRHPLFVPLAAKRVRYRRPRDSTGRATH